MREGGLSFAVRHVHERTSDHMRFSQNDRPVVVAIVLLGVACLLHLVGGSVGSTGSLGCCILAAVCLLLTWRGRDRIALAADAPSQPPEQPLILQTEREVNERTGSVPLSVLGADYLHDARLRVEETVDAILDSCIALVRSRIDAHTVAIFFPTDDGGYTIRRYASKSKFVNQKAVIYPGVGVIGGFLKGGLKQLKLTDIVTDSMTLYYYSRDAGIRSLMASPIVAAGVERGTIIVDSTTKGYFTDEHHSFLTSVADLCGHAVYNTYMANQHRLDHTRLVAMSSTEKHFFHNHDLDAVLDKMVEIIPYAFTCDRLTISLREPGANTATIRRVWGANTEGLLDLKFDLEGKSLASILYTKCISLFRDFSRRHYEVRYAADEPAVAGFGSFLAFPLGVDECKGTILLESVKRNIYSQRSRDLLARLVASAGIAIEKIQILKQTESLATRDGLTGLYNHRQFQQMLRDAITRSIRYGSDLSLVMCDIDHFKKLNDTHGHRFGDTVLKATAVQLQRSIREGVDTASRYGGEEFTLILEKTDAALAVETVERIRQEIARRIFQTPQGTEVNVTMSFGIAVYGLHAREQELLIQRADKAMYRAKENGRNCAELYFGTPETEIS